MFDSPAKARRRPRHRLGLSLVASLLGLGLVLTGCSSDSEPSASPSASGQGEVFLEAKDDQGPDPFTESTVGDFEDTRETAEPESPDSSAPSESASAEGDASGSETSGIQSTRGTTDELYGGSGDQTVCDRAQLTQFLQQTPDKAAAWAGVLGINTTSIPTYIEALAPVVLDNDIRVTNHGFANGTATPRQSVLEAGTAVLVDNRGVPRVRCACGNPLLEPVATPVGPNYVGTAWSNFTPDKIIVIVPGVIVRQLVVIDIRSGEPIRIPVGDTEGNTTQSPSSSASQSPTSSASPSGTASPGGNNAEYTSCAKRYGELVLEMKVSGITPSASQLQRWAQDAEAAAELANAGDLNGARAKICATVEEMEQVVGG